VPLSFNYGGRYRPLLLHGNVTVLQGNATVLRGSETAMETQLCCMETALPSPGFYPEISEFFESLVIFLNFYFKK
jgi:hypothetical protein